jgi:phenylacetate-CoA ligase
MIAIFDRRHETMPREELEQFQLERLQALLARLRRNVPRFARFMNELRVEALSDLPRLPLLTPEDLGKAFPYGMFALPLREVIRLHSAMGTNGSQLVIGHTRNDLGQWARLAARQLVAAGGTGHDVIQIGFGGSVFVQALGYMLGAELIEASVIPQDVHHTEYQLAMMRSYRPSILITTPTQAHDLIATMVRRGIDPQSLQVRTVLLSRPLPPEERAALKTGLFADIRCSFGVPEVLNPGLCVECPEGHLHVNEDQFLVESIDGELVVTTLAREAMPLLRYCTRIRCGLARHKCACGRTGAILTPGERMDGRLRVNEMPLYRSQVETLLNGTRAAGCPFVLDISEREVVVSLMVTSDLFPDTVREMETLREQIQSEALAQFGIRATTAFLSPREFERKAAQGQ